MKKPPTGRSRTRVRISKELRGAVHSRLLEVGARRDDFDLVVNAFVIHYACDVRNKKALQAHLLQLDAPLLRQDADTTVTLRLRDKAWQVLEDIEDEANLGKSDLIRRVLFCFTAEPLVRPGEESSHPAAPLLWQVRRLALVL